MDPTGFKVSLQMIALRILPISRKLFDLCNVAREGNTMVKKKLEKVVRQLSNITKMEYVGRDREAYGDSLERLGRIPVHGSRHAIDC